MNITLYYAIVCKYGMSQWALYWLCNCLIARNVGRQAIATKSGQLDQWHMWPYESFVIVTTDDQKDWPPKGQGQVIGHPLWPHQFHSSFVFIHFDFFSPLFFPLPDIFNSKFWIIDSSRSKSWVVVALKTFDQNYDTNKTTNVIKHFEAKNWDRRMDGWESLMTLLLR